MVVQLMKYGADPSLIDGEGCSCVHLAAQFGHTSIVAYLIAKGQVGNANTAAYLSGRKPNLKIHKLFFSTEQNMFSCDRRSLD